MPQELTKREVEQQDKVDNAIHALLIELAPAGVELEWDISVISEIRENIVEHFKKTVPDFKEREFYAWIGD